MRKWAEKYPVIPFAAPFAAFIALLGLQSTLGLSLSWEYPLRVVVVSAVLALFSLPLISQRPRYAIQSVLVGLAVFVIWVGPDIAWPSYRSHWLFQNGLMGTVRSSIPAGTRSDLVFLGFRLFGTAIVVPMIEELFWRGWLMRYIIHSEFQKVPFGKYAPLSFWLTAIFFASEHGPFWEVGLLAGIIYNGWMIRTRNLSDCILAHAVTNACLGAYVLVFGKWQYWL